MPEMPKRKPTDPTPVRPQAASSPPPSTPSSAASSGGPASSTATQGGSDTESGGGELRLHVPPDLDYVYRDMFSIFVSPEEVILEFGNRHRAIQNQATIKNRIVLSVPNAFRLQQGLGQALKNLQDRIAAEQHRTGTEPKR